MTSHLLDADLPEHPDQRRVVVVLSDKDVARSRNEGVARYLVTSPQTCFLRHTTELIKPSSLLQTMISKNQYSPGSTLVLNPFDNGSYQSLDKAAEDSVVKKAISFSLLCGYLGAKLVELKRASFEIDSKQFSAECESGLPQFNAELSGQIGYSKARSLTESMKLRDVYGSSDPDITKAEEFLRESGLDGDPVASSLVRTRRDAIPIKNRSFHLNVTNEINSAINLAMNLEIPGFIKQNSKMDYSSIKKMNVELDIEVEF